MYPAGDDVTGVEPEDGSGKVLYDEGKAQDILALLASESSAVQSVAFGSFGATVDFVGIHPTDEVLKGAFAKKLKTFSTDTITTALGQFRQELGEKTVFTLGIRNNTGRIANLGAANCTFADGLGSILDIQPISTEVGIPVQTQAKYENYITFSAADPQTLSYQLKVSGIQMALEWD